MEASRCSMLVALPVNLPRQLGQQRTLFMAVKKMERVDSDQQQQFTHLGIVLALVAQGMSLFALIDPAALQRIEADRTLRTGGQWR